MKKLVIKFYHGGCYHRQCSPIAYKIIDEFLKGKNLPFSFENNHEHGPEIFTILAANIDLINFIRSISELAVTIIKARYEGITQGDRNYSTPLEIVMREYNNEQLLKEERIIKIGSRDLIDKSTVEKILLEASKDFFKTDTCPRKKKS